MLNIIRNAVRSTTHLVCFLLNSSCIHNTFGAILSPASLAGAGDIETHRVRPSVRLSVRPDEFVQAISQLLFTVGG